MQHNVSTFLYRTCHDPISTIGLLGNKSRNKVVYSGRMIDRVLYRSFVLVNLKLCLYVVPCYILLGMSNRQKVHVIKRVGVDNDI